MTPQRRAQPGLNSMEAVPDYIILFLELQSVLRNYPTLGGQRNSLNWGVLASS
jgi:hypothetical protein